MIEEIVKSVNSCLQKFKDDFVLDTYEIYSDFCGSERIKIDFFNTIRNDPERFAAFKRMTGLEDTGDSFRGSRRRLKFTDLTMSLVSVQCLMPVYSVEGAMIDEEEGREETCCFGNFLFLRNKTFWSVNDAYRTRIVKEIYPDVQTAISRRMIQIMLLMLILS